MSRGCPIYVEEVLKEPFGKRILLSSRKKTRIISKVLSMCGHTAEWVKLTLRNWVDQRLPSRVESPSSDSLSISSTSEDGQKVESKKSRDIITLINIDGISKLNLHCLWLTCKLIIDGYLEEGLMGLLVYSCCNARYETTTTRYIDKLFNNVMLLLSDGHAYVEDVLSLITSAYNDKDKTSIKCTHRYGSTFGFVIDWMFLTYSKLPSICIVDDFEKLFLGNTSHVQRILPMDLITRKRPCITIGYCLGSQNLSFLYAARHKIIDDENRIDSRMLHKLTEGEEVMAFRLKATCKLLHRCIQIIFDAYAHKIHFSLQDVLTCYQTYIILMKTVGKFDRHKNFIDICETILIHVLVKGNVFTLAGDDRQRHMLNLLANDCSKTLDKSNSGRKRMKKYYGAMQPMEKILESAKILATIEALFMVNHSSPESSAEESREEIRDKPVGDEFTTAKEIHLNFVRAVRVYDPPSLY